MILIPANCPAEVRLVIDMIIAAHGGMPAPTASIPKENDTGIYPSAIGMLSFAPFINCLVFVKICIHSDFLYYYILYSK